MPNVTIRDVAKCAGVSASTVSRVTQKQPTVHSKTRTKVLKAIKKLNYHVNIAARSMVKKQTKTIGLSISDISNLFYPPLVRGIEDTINKLGYNLILCNTDENPEKEKKYLKLMLEKRVDGLIISPVEQKLSYLKEFEKREIPIVLVVRERKNIQSDLVCVDNVSGAFSAVEHFIKLGHKRIAMATCLGTVSTSPDRVKGYLKALKEYNLEVDESLILEDDASVEGGMKVGEKLLKLDPPPTALLSTATVMTLGIWTVLKKKRKNIPKEIAIINFDDLEWAGALDPPLTTIYQPTYTMGSTSAQLLMQRLSGEGPIRKQKIVLKTELIIRQSCGYFRKRN